MCYIWRMEKVPSSLNEKEREEILRVENTLKELLPINELVSIFGSGSFLIGGAVRDAILRRSPGDFDFMSRYTVETIKQNLDNLGFNEIQWKEGVAFENGKYSFNVGARVFNFVIEEKEIQVASIGEKEISELIATADSNLSCCAFDMGSLKIQNPDFFVEIMNREFRFIDPELVKSDPMKIVNALKQISRLPDLKVSDADMQIISQSIPMVIEFFAENPHRRHKLKPLFGNINSGQVLSLFEAFDTKNILDGLNKKKNKLNVSDRFHSVPIEELEPAIKAKLSAFIASRFGKRFDPSKLFNDKINSVAYEIDGLGDILSCCQIDGERLYATSAVSSEKIVELVGDLCRNNYNVWSTISISSTLLINLCPLAGLNIVEDPVLVEKIITNNYPQYKGKLLIGKKRGHAVFSKTDSDDTPQVLVMS